VFNNKTMFQLDTNSAYGNSDMRAAALKVTSKYQKNGGSEE
jgi:hypothetical protein